MTTALSLDRGHYLGKVVDQHYCDGIIAAATQYLEDRQTSQLHYHDNLHISFVLRGGSVEKRGGGQQYERLPGDIMFYHAGEAHQNIQKIFPSKNINLEIENDFLTKHGITDAAIARAIMRNPDSKILLLRVYHELTANDHFSPASIHMLFLDLISWSENQHQKKYFPTWIKTIDELLHDQDNGKLTLADLAGTAGVHPITISKHFHIYYGCTLGEHMRKLKIEKALTMINAGKVSLTKIAYTCGFADQSHFTRTFKQLTGLLPGKYQKLQEC